MNPSSFLILGIVAVGLAALYLAGAWLLARIWCKPKRLPRTNTPADVELPFEAVQFSSQGVPIEGWFIPAAASTQRQPAVVLAHGWCKNAGDLLLMARTLHQNGFALLLYDARGHGLSGADGPITILKMAEDAVAAVQYVGTRSDVDQNRVGLLGRSIGGSAAIVAASMESHIQAVVSCSAFADPKALTRDFLTMLHVPPALFSRPVFYFIERWLGTTMDDVAPRNRISRITAPLLLIHGEADRYIRPANMEILYAQAPRERTQQLLIPKRSHSDVIRDVKCSQEIVTFFCKNLQPAGVAISLEADRTRAEEAQVEAK
jgi:dipeptidyl aminopeptidase/acylaminoacyl peptidase